MTATATGMAARTAARVELVGVEKRFGSVRAVAPTDLAIAAGEFVALLGPSGCGKTTTLRMIAGLEQPSAGEIRVDGRVINAVPVHRRNFGMVFQDLALFPHKTAFENIGFGLKYRKVAPAEIEARVRRALEIVRLPQVGDRYPHQLSGGQQQRVAVARAIVIEPDLLLFDEPLSALDANLREEMRVELKRIHRTLGITTVFVTHDQAEALSMSDRIVLMRDGRIEQEGPPDTLYLRPRSEFAARFFGHVNELAGVIALKSVGEAMVRLVGETAVVQVVGLRGEVGEKVRILVRAERVDVAPAPVEGETVMAVLGTVVASDYLGLLVRYQLDIGGGQQLVALQPAQGSILAPGAVVAARIPADAWLRTVAETSEPIDGQGDLHLPLGSGSG